MSEKAVEVLNALKALTKLVAPALKELDAATKKSGKQGRFHYRFAQVASSIIALNDRGQGTLESLKAEKAAAKEAEKAAKSAPKGAVKKAPAKVEPPKVSAPAKQGATRLQATKKADAPVAKTAIKKTAKKPVAAPVDDEV